MKSTGEVMGIDVTFGKAFYKSQAAAGQSLPRQGAIFLSVKDADKQDILVIAKRLAKLGFKLIATKGTYQAFLANGIKAQLVGKIAEGDTKILDLVKSGEIKLIINTPSGEKGQLDSNPIRSVAVMQAVPCITTVQGAQAAVGGIEAVLKENLEVKSIQEYLKN
jgi:carbamoyl-phosphate synthase large subunit